MAWSISISAEGWADIRVALEQWDRDALITAICDDKFEVVEAKGGQEHALRAAEAERRRLEQLTHDILVDRAYELIEQNGTSDNGGWAYRIDRQGYHRVHLCDDRETE
jgi:hypothetical protein